MKKDLKEYMREYNKQRFRISLNLHKDKDSDIVLAIEEAGEGNYQLGLKRIVRYYIQAKEDEYKKDLLG